MTWTAAAFARVLARATATNTSSYARHGIEYLDRVMRDREQGGFHWVLDPHGKVDPKLGDEKHVYGTAFALYAASEAHEVTHDLTALKVARDAFDWLESHAHDAEHGGYFEALTRDGTPILAWDDAPDRATGRPAGRLLRLQVDELPHPSAGSAGRVLPGREDAAGRRSGSPRPSPSSATGSPSSRAP